MKLKFFKIEVDTLVAKEIANKLVSILLTIALCISVAFNFKLKSEVKTIIVPAILSQEFWVSDDAISDKGLEQMCLIIYSTLFNASPATAHEQFKLILTLASPVFYQKIKSELSNQAKYLNANGVSSVFYKKSLTPNKDSSITVKGERKYLIGDKVVENKEITLKIFYEVQNGRFYITNLETK